MFENSYKLIVIIKICYVIENKISSPFIGICIFKVGKKYVTWKCIFLYTVLMIDFNICTILPNWRGIIKHVNVTELL